MEPAVFILEPQTLFVPELAQVIALAGGRVVRAATHIDVEEIASLAADYALLDLDYTAHGVLDGLAYFRAAAPSVRAILITAEHGPDWLERCRAAGAWAVVSKDSDREEIAALLRGAFAGEAFADPRVNAA